MKTFFKEFQGYRAYKKLPKSYKKVVFYSESFQDWHHLKPLLNALLDDDIAVTYVTSDDKDPGLLKLSKNMNLSLKQVWRPLHTMSYLKNYQKMNLSNSNYIFKTTLCLPSSPDNL